MNLYELAENLKSWADDVYGGGKTLTDAANMLLQQKYEIEDLKNANRFIQNFAEEQHQRAVALEMRELTDEEIMELWYPLDLHDEAWVDDAVLRDFARAILKKASEK